MFWTDWQSERVWGRTSQRTNDDNSSITTSLYILYTKKAHYSHRDSLLSVTISLISHSSNFFQSPSSYTTLYVFSKPCTPRSTIVPTCQPLSNSFLTFAPTPNLYYLYPHVHTTRFLCLSFPFFGLLLFVF